MTNSAAPLRLPRQVTLLGAVSLLNDFASEMIYPLLPAFVTGVLGAGPQALGALDGAAEFAAAAVKLGAGRLADRRQLRGPLIVWGYVAAVVVRPAIALTGAAWQVIALRVTDRLGKGLRTPPRDALIADVTPAPAWGRAFGLQRGLDHAGAVLGPLAAWWLLASHTAALRGVIAASLVPGVAVLALAIWAVHGGRAGGAPGAAGRGGAAAPAGARGAPGASGGSWLPPPLAAIALFSLVRMPDTLVILHTQQLGVSVAVVPLLWAAVHVVRSGSSFLGGRASDRLGPGRTMWLGWAAYAVLAAAMARAASAAAGWGVFLALGIVAGLTESPERALIARLAGTRQGSGFGVYHGATGLAALAGGLALGAVFQAGGGPRAFLLSAALAGGLAAASAGISLRRAAVNSSGAGPWPPGPAPRTRVR
jgi:MFS family permease